MTKYRQENKKVNETFYCSQTDICTKRQQHTKFTGLHGKDMIVLQDKSKGNRHWKDNFFCQLQCQGRLDFPIKNDIMHASEGDCKNKQENIGLPICSMDKMSEAENPLLKKMKGKRYKKIRRKNNNEAVGMWPEI